MAARGQRRASGSPQPPAHWSPAHWPPEPAVSVRPAQAPWAHEARPDRRPSMGLGPRAAGPSGWAVRDRPASNYPGPGAPPAGRWNEEGGGGIGRPGAGVAGQSGWGRGGPRCGSGRRGRPGHLARAAPLSGRLLDASWAVPVCGRPVTGRSARRDAAGRGMGAGRGRGPGRSGLARRLPGVRCGFGRPGAGSLVRSGGANLPDRPYDGQRSACCSSMLEE